MFFFSFELLLSLTLLQYKSTIKFIQFGIKNKNNYNYNKIELYRL